MTFWRKRVGVEGYKRVFGTVFLERVIETEEPREVRCIRDEGCPYCESISNCDRDQYSCCSIALPFFELPGAAPSIVNSVIIIKLTPSVGLMRSVHRLCRMAAA